MIVKLWTSENEKKKLSKRAIKANADNESRMGCVKRVPDSQQKIAQGTQKGDLVPDETEDEIKCGTDEALCGTTSQFMLESSVDTKLLTIKLSPALRKR